MRRMWMCLYLTSWWAVLADPPEIDWRTLLAPQVRRNIISRMTVTFMTRVVATRLQLSQQLRRMAVLFEEKTYAAATSRSDYLTTISLRMIKVEETLPLRVGNSFQTNPGTSNQIPAVQGDDWSN